MILPGQAIGVLGGGELGRMLAQSAQSMGYRVHVYEPAGPSPAGAVSDREINEPYDHLKPLVEFASSVEVVTCEFGNIPVDPLEAIAKLVPVRPNPSVLRICQNKQREKAWLRSHGIAHVSYAEALDGDIASGAAFVGIPCVVKTADFSADGKGQMKISDAADLELAVAIFRGRRCLVEQWVEFACEISVICIRSLSGEIRPFPVAENVHENYLLDTTIVPARITPEQASEAQALASRIADRLGVVGLLAVEMFVVVSGELIVNGLAPGPHNSGHWSIEGAETSQFEQHVRAVCGLPLGPAGLRSPTVMVNILGDAWKWSDDGAVGEPDWKGILSEPSAKLHLYGKSEPRLGRKMGHFTVRAETGEDALAIAAKLKAGL